MAYLEASAMTEPSVLEFVIFALATFRICRFLIEDALFEPVRDRIWAKWPPESTKLGYLLTCYWCLSIWIAIPLGIGMLFGGIIAFVAAAILALSAVAGIIQGLLDR